MLSGSGGPPFDPRPTSTSTATPSASTALIPHPIFGPGAQNALVQYRTQFPGISGTTDEPTIPNAPPNSPASPLDRDLDLQNEAYLDPCYYAVSHLSPEFSRSVSETSSTLSVVDEEEDQLRHGFLVDESDNEEGDELEYVDQADTNDLNVSDSD